ncbi:alpha/beta-hydrolase [Glonium stellatum]|uniref:Alpha/beta-hydrolase n=1 Tax=Glonium stellatum TaxID=574774 RepID=A0A8E2F1Y7_9PEZI|nr:alpha/beta-hydrolase [Glonium stellatum]
MKSTKPSVVFVPGAWHHPAIFSSVEALLHEAGYADTVGVRLPSCGADPPVSNREPDIIAIRSEIEGRITKGKDIVLVAHSYGGIPTSEAVEGLPPKAEGENVEEQEQNSGGKVIGIVYICALVPDIGMPSSTDAWKEQLQPWARLDGGYIYPDADPSNPPAKLFYSDLQKDEAEAWAARLELRQSGLSISEPQRYVPWKGDFQCIYVICEGDCTLPKAVQEEWVTRPEVKFRVERCSAGHSPMISQPKFVAEIIRKLAGEDF